MRSTQRASRRLSFESLECRELLANLPTGFTESAIATSLSSATAMEIAPNGDLWVLQQGGAVKRFIPGSTTADIVGNLSSLGLSSSGERGLLGIAFDPDYATTRHVFLYYTATSPSVHNRISRFTVVDTNAADYYFAGTSTAPADDGASGTPTQTVTFNLDNLSSATNHNGGAIHFGPDGKLYAAVGDNASGANAQTLANLHGKMLRINKDGSIPTDNPFYGVATGSERAIWALGLRNPFTFTFQSGTGLMFINDVGQNEWEEINEGIAGSNYGWPSVEGNEGTPPGGPGVYLGPLYAYSHGGGTFQGFAITGGTFYSPPIQQFPEAFAGDYFFADYVNDWINVIDVTSGNVTRFASGAPGAVDLRVAPDGSLYYLARDANAVFRVEHTASEAPNITQEPAGGTVSEGRAATFSVAATGSVPLTYQWQKLVGMNWMDVINDGRISGARGATMTITGSQLSDAGSYRVIVSNTVGSDTSATVDLTVTPNQPPAGDITITSGLTGGRFVAGRVITFSGTGVDPEEGQLAAGRFSWQVDYITSIASGNPVARPFISAFSGQPGGTFTPATTGPYTLADVAYRISLTVRDSAGLTHTVVEEVAPNVSTVTIATDPEALRITVDGQTFTSPHTFDSVAGFQRPIGAPASQALGSDNFSFTNWSDGGAATHTIITPSSSASYTASYVAVPEPFAVKVNFQTAASQGFPEYALDRGLVFGYRGNGFSYGWNAPNMTARNRNLRRSPDERFDTLIHMQRPVNRNARWEIALPSGTYTVRLVAGDPRFFDGNYRIRAEGVLAINAKPTSRQRWIERTVQVTVTDGRLTISNAPGARNNTLAFVEITQIPPAAAAAASSR